MRPYSRAARAHGPATERMSAGRSSKVGTHPLPHENGADVSRRVYNQNYELFYAVCPNLCLMMAISPKSQVP